METIITLIIVGLIAYFFLFSFNSERVKTNITDTPEHFEISGVQLNCIHCKNDTFYGGKAQMNTSISSFIGFDWLNKEASFLSCSNCGFMHWFRRDPSEINNWVIKGK